MERTLFGRETELAVVSGLLDAIPSGPVALTLGGEAGIGKSALCLEAVSQGRDRSYRVLSCAPSESEAKLSFAALGDLLREVADEILEGLPPPQRAALEGALLRSEVAESSLDQRATASAFHATLVKLAAAGPCLLAIDDAQWLDAPSARVLEFAIRRLNEVPVGLIVTVRSPELETLPLGLARALPADRLHRLMVGPITLQASHDVLNAALSTGFPRSVMGRIHEASAGNPFFVLELGRALLRRGLAHEPGRSLSVPSDLVGLVRDRMSEVSPGIRQVLLVIAAAAQPTVELVADAIGGATAKSDIEAAFEANVIEESGARLRLAHPLLATVLYSESPGEVRRDIHRRLAAVVADQEERARHLALAADGPDENVAAELADAARHARARGALESAAELYELARGLTPSDHAEARLHRTVHAGQYAFEAADMVRAAALLEEAVGAAPAGWLRAEALLFLARVHYHSHDAHSAQSLAAQALAEPALDPALKTQIQLELSAASQAAGDRVAARVHARAALDLAEDQDDHATLAEALALVGFQSFLSGEGFPREVMSRAIELEGAGRVPRPVRSPTFQQACMLMWTDDLDAARSAFEDLEKLCREGGDEGSLAVILFLLAQVECLAGNWIAAGRHADESCTITAWTAQQPYRAVALSAKALIEAHLGRVQTARVAAEEGLELARDSGLVQATLFNLSALGFLELSLGNVEEAHRILWPLAEGLLASGPVEPGVLRFLPDAIEVLVVSGETDVARTLIDSTLTRAKTLGRVWAVAAAERGRGLLAGSLGDMPEAFAAFDRALESHRLLDEPFELGRTLLAQGQAFRRTKKWRLARETLGRSLEIFERLGAELWATKTREELARIGGRAPAPVGLTPTEKQVADLVATGLTNQEAARALFLSVSTVEANLRRIYRKLDVRSRTELSRKLADR